MQQTYAVERTNTEATVIQWEHNQLAQMSALKQEIETQSTTAASAENTTFRNRLTAEARAEVAKVMQLEQETNAANYALTRQKLEQEAEQFKESHTADTEQVWIAKAEAYTESCRSMARSECKNHEQLLQEQLMHQHKAILEQAHADRQTADYQTRMEKEALRLEYMEQNIMNKAKYLHAEESAQYEAIDVQKQNDRLESQIQYMMDNGSVRSTRSAATQKALMEMQKMQEENRTESDKKDALIRDLVARLPQQSSTSKSEQENASQPRDTNFTGPALPQQKPEHVRMTPTATPRTPPATPTRQKLTPDKTLFGAPEGGSLYCDVGGR
jgi:hypothetical protein